VTPLFPLNVTVTNLYNTVVFLLPLVLQLARLTSNGM